MTGFIELEYTNGNKMLLNIAYIITVSANEDGGTGILTKDKHRWHANAPYDEIKALIYDASRKCQK